MEPVALGPQGRYRLVRRIATGGMGEVWQADDTVLGRRVALKLLVEELAADDRATRRFVREARATARLAHPNVARVFDFGRDGGAPFLVMELLEGETLAARLASGPFGPAEAARVAAAVADALEAAHQLGIVHRDVKPSNVMLTRDGEVKVLDFGIAAAADETHSTTGSGLYATVAYVSPERVAGEPATPASDVYSLGAVLYELLCGRPPFSGPSPALVARAHLHDQPVPVRQLAPWVPARLAEACQAALDKDPARRPSSAASLAIRLRAAVAATSAPEAAGPAATVRVGTGGPVWRRHRRRVTVLLGVVLAALLAVVAARELGLWPAGGPEPAAARAAAVTVTLDATDRVWARATVDGRVAYQGILVAGDQRTFTARRAVDLHLGNAGGARLTVDGRDRGAPGRPGQIWRGRFVPGA
ncbi:MAG TPA: RodZ domain-containing protein [Actinomycetota bacterium]|nr:RodZ domain-containing protein [Actinomycetota bacterium]